MSCIEGLNVASEWTKPRREKLFRVLIDISELDRTR